MRIAPIILFALNAYLLMFILLQHNYTGAATASIALLLAYNIILPPR